VAIRVAFDSTTPDAIPLDATMVWGYVDGSFAWPDTAWARFPHATKVRICVTGDHAKGNMLDVERGDATPDHAPGWVNARRTAGEKYVAVYAARDTWPAINQAFQQANVKPPFRAVATLDGTLHVDGFEPFHGPAAVQFGSARMAGINVDVSLVYEDDWHPQASPDVIRQCRTDMTHIVNGAESIRTLAAFVERSLATFG
jgi:hypothetical protein